MDTGMWFGAGFEYQVWKTVDEEEFFTIRSRSVYVRQLHSSCKTTGPWIPSRELRATEMNMGSNVRFHIWPVTRQIG